MNAVEFEALELMEGWSDDDPTMRNRFAFPVGAQTGTAAAAVVYFEVKPGQNCGRHLHSTEEVMVIVEGTAEVEIDGEGRTVAAPGLADVPAWTPITCTPAARRPFESPASSPAPCFSLASSRRWRRSG